MKRLFIFLAAALIAVSGMGQTAKNRFLADIYGHADPADLTADEMQKSAGDVIDDLADRYGILDSGVDISDRSVLLEMVIARYKLSLNYYQKYLSTVLARDVSDKTISAIEAEFNSDQDGIQIEEELVRRYTDPYYFSNIIGYTGRIVGEGEPKYLNTPETLLFNKSRFIAPASITVSPP